MSPNRWYNGNNKNHMETAEMERIMKTTIIGFPRVGSLRELKFASEKYFRNEITCISRNWTPISPWHAAIREHRAMSRHLP